MSQSIYISFFLFCLLFAKSAFASRTTVLVMGTGDAGIVLNGGSFFYDDAYNIFYNPAYINVHKNWGVLTKSNGASTAEAGFAFSMFNVNLGFYFNRGNAVTVSPNAGTPASFSPVTFSPSSYSATATPTRPIDFQLGFDLTNIKLGLGLTYSSTFQTTGNAGDLTLHAGAILERVGLEPFFSYKVLGQDGLAAISYSFWRAGTKYRFGEWTPYLGAAGWGTSASGITLRELTVGGGLGRNTHLTENVKLNFAVSFWAPTDTVTGVSTNSSRFIMPLDLAVEADPATWITVRGGFKFHIVDRLSGTYGSVSVPDSTNITNARLGASFHVGKADIDWAVGRTATSLESGLDSQVFDVGLGFFTAASFVYKW